MDFTKWLKGQVVRYGRWLIGIGFERYSGNRFQDKIGHQISNPRSAAGSTSLAISPENLRPQEKLDGPCPHYLSEYAS